MITEKRIKICCIIYQTALNKFNDSNKKRTINFEKKTNETKRNEMKRNSDT